MRLIGCHIENFGKLSNKDYKFDAKITEFCEENGFGKTTLATFVKAMFYGLPSVKSNTKFNDREHFYPFGGGIFGGNIVFEKSGDEYRIERIFDKKSETKDELIVYRNNKLCKDFGNDVGKFVFGLDSESFERTAFITSEDIEICATDGISAKLNGVVDNIDETTFAEAIDAIEKANKRLKASRGNNDLIGNKQKEITEIKSDIKNMETVVASLDEYYRSETELSRQINMLEEKVEEAGEVNLFLERWSQYDQMVARRESYNGRLCEISSFYMDTIPSDVDVSKLKEYSREIAVIEGQADTGAFDDTKRLRLNELGEKFFDGAPTDAEMASLQSDINSVKNLTAEIKSLSMDAQPTHAEELKRKYADKQPTDDEIKTVRDKISLYKDLDETMKVKTEIIANSVPTVKSAIPKSTIIIAVAALIAIIVGAGVCFVNIVAGLVLMLLGTVGLGVGAFLYFRKRSLNGASTVVVDENIVKQQAEKQRIEADVRSFLVQYGYYSSNGIAFDFAMLERDLNEYRKIVEAESTSNAKIEKKQSECSFLANKVRDYFSAYGIDSDDLQAGYNKLQSIIMEFSTLKSQSDATQLKRDNAENKLQELKSQVNRIFAKYGIDAGSDVTEQVELMDKNVAEAARLKSDMQKIDVEINTYKERYELYARPVGEFADVHDLQEKLSELRNSRAILSGQISDAEDYAERLEDKRNQLERAEEQLGQYKYKNNIFSETVKFMRAAEQNLKDKYISPIKSNFVTYADAIESTLGEKVSMDQDFNIMFERCGQNRSDKHLSAGQRSVCALCFRLALIDNMYENEKPFIIMDDPFVNLDTKHLGRTLEIVKTLSEKHQIIYFSCHDSRKIARGK